MGFSWENELYVYVVYGCIKSGKENFMKMAAVYTTKNLSSPQRKNT